MTIDRTRPIFKIEFVAQQPATYWNTIDALMGIKGSSATRNSVGQPSTDENNCDNGFARLEAQPLAVQAVPP